MNNKTIIEVGFRIIWRIMEISKGVIRDNTLLDLHNSSQDTHPHSLIVKYTYLLRFDNLAESLQQDDSSCCELLQSPTLIRDAFVQTPLPSGKIWFFLSGRGVCTQATWEMGSTFPTPFQHQCGFFYVEGDKVKGLVSPLNDAIIWDV